MSPCRSNTAGICVDLPGSKLHGARVKCPLRRPQQHYHHPLDVIWHVPPSQEWANLEEKGMHCLGWNIPRLPPTFSTGHNSITCVHTPASDHGKLRLRWQPVDWQSHTAASQSTLTSISHCLISLLRVLSSPFLTLKFISAFFTIYLIVLHQFQPDIHKCYVNLLAHNKIKIHSPYVSRYATYNYFDTLRESSLTSSWISGVKSLDD